MKILREGDHVFVLGPACGFNTKQIARVVLEDCHAMYGGDLGSVFLSIQSGGSTVSLTVTRDEARQMFQDTPWMLILKEHK